MKKLDFKGLKCPMPVMKLAIEARKGKSGDVFEILCDDAGFEPDIKAWCSETGHVLDNLKKTGTEIRAIVKLK